MRTRTVITMIVAAALTASACTNKPTDTSTGPTTSDLQRIVEDRVHSGRSTGIVAGVVLPDGTTRLAGYGEDHGRPLDGDSVFEIGSITKTFTATLLALMVQDHDVDLDDPVASLLPPGTSVPRRDGIQITLEDLATHTSGLPRNPTNLDPKDPANPYADYTVTQFYDFLGSYQLTTAPGSHFEYSNLGVALLGHALALRAGLPFEELVRTRILEPLDMTSTGITLDTATEGRFVDGHDATGDVTAHFDMPVLAGEGALRSSLNDMLKFAAANLDPHVSELHQAMATARQPRRPTDVAAQDVALSWLVDDRSGNTIIWHGGATGGFFAYIGLDPIHRTAAVVLSNSRAKNIDDIGLHLLDHTHPLLPPPVQRVEAALSPAVLARYVGDYELLGATATITQAAEGLTVRLPGEKPIRLYAESPNTFFFTDFEGRVNFELDANGDVTSGTFHDQDGQMSSIARHRRQVTLTDDVLDRYVGTYNVAGTDATITRSAEGLTAVLPDGPIELYPETTTRFFVKEVDAQVLFQIDADGRPTGAFLYEAGQDPVSIAVAD
jgi:D-alanyl-D-alanine-carboxypeptidase/D-alanyl-D-alanine-endopeptidase